jgi:hypothetical protein
MNSVLQLRGTLNKQKSGGKPGAPNMPKRNGASVSVNRIEKLIADLKALEKFWQKDNLIDGALVDVHYNCVVAKSNRIGGFLLRKGQNTTNDSVRGARFVDANTPSPKHIITHYVTDDIIEDSIKKAEVSKKILDAEFGGNISHDEIAKVKNKDIKFKDYGISESTFLNIVVDTYYVDGFDVPNNSANATGEQLVTIYKTNKSAEEILKSLGIDTLGKSLNDSTLLLYPDDIKTLQNQAPYLIAMAVEDITELSIEDITGDNTNDSDSSYIPEPTNEPVIGVIDTLFDTGVYFSKWVDYVPMVSHDIIDPKDPKDPADYNHGTAVSSIVVDGHNINPDLDDGCGRFRVKHFGVVGSKPFSSFTVIKNIQDIVNKNPSIKVWNLSLGSTKEINGNFISPEAAALDQIQVDNDVIFVVAGTNKPKDQTDNMLIGAPADSINSMVVNSVDSSGKEASYSRIGEVLSFFNKPDVSAMGGDGSKNDGRIRVCEPNGEAFVAGTSFAAPWIARKLAYLIEVLGLSREVAKALIVDAAASWNDTGNNHDLAPLIGHGVVPIKIDNIVKSNDNEIKFIMSGTSEQYDTYAYNLPVPVNKNAHPFVTKATLCYFPECSANQGVDYTDTELDVSIGRIAKLSTKDGIPRYGINTINKNVQTLRGFWTPESDARKFFRKWDNTKHIREKYGDSLRARKAYESGMWGISVKRKERLDKEKKPVKFGLVVTLKEVNGINRAQDFMQKARLAGWTVNEINVETQVDIYNQLQQPLNFDS